MTDLLLIGKKIKLNVTRNRRQLGFLSNDGTECDQHSVLYFVLSKQTYLFGKCEDLSIPGDH